MAMKTAEASRPQGIRETVPSGVIAACVGLGIPLGMLALSAIHPAMMWRRYSDVLPVICLACGGLPSIVAIVLSIRSLWRHPSSRAWAGLTLGLLGIPICLAITWWLGMMVLASHPV
jgi:hypothetical protein